MQQSKSMAIQLKFLILMIGMETLYCQELQNQFCSPRCEECSVLSSGCRRCKPGWWGRDCGKVCLDDHCFQDTCEIHSGRCTYGCKDGWYNNFYDDRCVPCESNCLRCLNKDHCIVCKDGKFGDACKWDSKYPCTQCEQAYTDTSFGASFHHKCLKCAEGMYGTGLGCYYECSSCIDNACSRDGCTYGCKEGMYNFGHHNLCVRCFPGCASCNGFSFKDKECLTCKPGKWGNICDKDCSHSCPLKLCHQSSGECLCEKGYYLTAEGSCEMCLPSCSTCLTDDSCTSCREGIFGDKCENRCPGNCSECSSDGSTCISCPAEYYMRNNRCYPCGIGCSSCWWMKRSVKLECSRCKEGFYKDFMRGRHIFKCFPCPTGCSSCNRSGECQSCLPGFHLFNRKCCPDNCITCATAEKCTVCEDGYFGLSCERKCKDTCQKCYSQDECGFCKTGFYSNTQKGEQTCNCASSECSERSENGTCQSCNQVGWYTSGEGCCECSRCKNNYCDAKGRCLEGCPSVSKFGSFCNLDCSKAIHGCVECVGEIRSTVQCLKCDPSMYLSDNSCHRCSYNCLYARCNNDGTCTSGCIKGWFGQFCDFKCSDQCLSYLQYMSNFYIKLVSLLSRIFKYP